MDSLGQIGSSLTQVGAQDQADKDLSAAFKVAAASLTGLFKVGRRATRQAYRAGKREALQDVLEFIQASLDHQVHPSPGPSPPSTSIVPPSPIVTARLIDYLEARQEALRAEEEDDEEQDATTHPSNSAHAHATRSSAVASTTAPSMFSSDASRTRRNPPSQQQQPPISSPAQPLPPQRERDRDRPYPTASSSTLSSTVLPSSSSSASVFVPPPSVNSTPVAPSSSPLAATTRLQARREREHSRKSTKSSAAHSHAQHSLAAPPVVTSVVPLSPAAQAAGESEQQGLGLGVKRRWNAVNTTDVAVDIGSGSDTPVPSRLEDDLLDNAGDGMEFEMETIERPSKRIMARRP